MITNRGVKVFPEGLKETYCTDHWRCRFVAFDADTQKPAYKPISFEQILTLLSKIHLSGFDVIKTEKLGERSVKFTFKDNSNAELPLILSHLS